MSLSDVIDYFSTETFDPNGSYTVTRVPVRVVDSHGRLTAPSGTTTFGITGGIQPTNGRDLDILVESGVTSESRKLYSNTQLQTRVPGREPDKVTIDNESWTVYTCTRWQGFDETIFICLIARDEQS
jgi:hypothetical protein